jgi:DNA-binding MarR family transcriptional regulator
MSACPSGDERVRLFGLLSETNARLERDLGAALEESCDLPLPWFFVLLKLRRSPQGHLTMSEIADATVHSSGGTTRLVDRIVEAGYVERMSCPSDRRAIHVVITDAGNAILDAALVAHLQHLEHHLEERLSRDEREQLTDLLAKLNQSTVEV